MTLLVLVGILSVLVGIVKLRAHKEEYRLLEMKLDKRTKREKYVMSAEQALRYAWEQER